MFVLLKYIFKLRCGGVKVRIMKNKYIFLFPGHGCQYYGMGLELYRNNQVFRDSMNELDRKIEVAVGYSILDVLYHSKIDINEDFEEFKYTHFAVFMFEYSMFQVIKQYGIQPDYLLGCSLGELVTLTVSGYYSIDSIIELLKISVQEIAHSSEKGEMYSVFATEDKYNESSFLKENSYFSGKYFEQNFTLSVQQEKAHEVKEYLRRNKIVFSKLPIQYPFHCEIVNQHYECFTKIPHIPTTNILNYPIWSSLLKGKLEFIPDDYFEKLMTKEVGFEEAIKNLPNNKEYIYVDMGPSGNMATCLHYIFNGNKEVKSYMVNMRSGNTEQNLNLFLAENGGKKMVAYIFAGQGSQRVGMGEGLFDKYSLLTETADNILGYSIKELCLKDRYSELGLTQFTQPALFVVNHLLYLDYIETYGKPDYLLGHSLGEYNALTAADVLTFGQALRLVKKRGELMSQAKKGGMTVISGISFEEVEKILREYPLKNVFISNYNSVTQTVVAGDMEEFSTISQTIENTGARLTSLNVSGAFHSKYMTEAKEEFLHYIEKEDFKDFKTPVISNLEGRPYRKEDVKEILQEQMDHPVRWVDSIRYLLAEKDDIEFIQISEGRFLLNLIGDIKKNTTENDLKRYKEDIKEKKSFPAEVVGGEYTEERVNTLGRKLGSKKFQKKYNVDYCYIAGGMYRGVSSVKMVEKLANKRILSFFGAGGLSLLEVEKNVQELNNRLKGKQFGVNFVHYPEHPEREMELAEYLIKNKIRVIEAAAFLYITEALVYYRVSGLRIFNGEIEYGNKIILKASRPEVVEAFIIQPPENLVEKLYQENKITEEQFHLSKQVMMIDDITVESSSGGHTDQRVSLVEVPSIIKIKNRCLKKYKESYEIGIGAAGGIGTPEAVAAMFVMGADYIVTGSINQCTVEAGTNDIVKDILQNINIQDTDFAPAGDMFEFGSKVQVVKKGGFFVARANKLYELYNQYQSIEELEDKTKEQLEKRFFKKSLDQVWEDIVNKYSNELIEHANRNEKFKMLLIFKWYLFQCTKDTLEGKAENRVNFQIQCGPALGAFNQQVLGTGQENWRNRTVDNIAIFLMEGAAKIIEQLAMEWK